MQTPNIETKILPPPPGIIGSLRAGFDVTAGNITAILLPVLLDLFLWLGPRLGVYKLMQPVIDYMQTALPTNSGLQPSDVTSMMTMYRQAFQAFNLMALLRTYPVGITSLISGKLPGLNPLGTPSIVQADSYVNLVGLIFLLTLVGWIFGGLYFRLVAALVSPETMPSATRTIMQTLLYSVIWVAACWILGLPVMFTLTLIFMFNNIVGEVVLVILAFVSMWLIVPVFFSPHGIFVKSQNAFGSILGSFQMARFTLPTSSLFILVIFTLAYASNFLWSIPASDSWLVLVGILGHGFVTTALLASSFKYYQDMTAWLQTVLARLRNGMPVNPANTA
jgi:hypothetical protein